MKHIELAKFKLAQYAKVGVYTLSELKEDGDTLFFYSTDKTGVKRLHSFAPDKASIVVVENEAEKEVAKEEPSVVEVAVEAVKEVVKTTTKKITKKKGQ